MVKERWVIACFAGLGLFAGGFLMGRQTVGESAGNSSSQTPTTRLPDRRDASAPLPERTRAKPAPRPADEKHTSYRKIVDMVSKGELRISGVDINSENFLPGDKVAEFFGLSEGQIAEMKQLGRERLREKQNREQSLAKIHEVSESGMVFDLPADPAFAAEEAAGFTESIGKSFGADMAAMLQPSIEQAYRDFSAPRHVRYSVTRQDHPVDGADLPPEIRLMQEGMRNVEISVNKNEDGTYMKDAQGMVLPNSGGSAGAFNLNDTKPDAYRPRYHHLWEREMERR